MKGGRGVRMKEEGKNKDKAWRARTGARGEGKGMNEGEIRTPAREERA